MSCTIALAAHERKALLDLYRHSPRANASRSDGTARIYVSIQVRFSMYGRHNCLLPKDLKMRLPCLSRPDSPPHLRHAVRRCLGG